MRELNVNEIKEVNGGIFALVAIHLIQVAAIVLTFTED